VVVSYGGGTNSTALLVGLVERGEPVDLILFADTGGERPGTYAFVQLFSGWLEVCGYPTITTIHATRAGERETLEAECVRIGSLPSLAYGYKKCSAKHKVQPQEKFINNWEPARLAWKSGALVTKLIGFDADEGSRVEKTQARPSKKYRVRFPLVEWNWGREECVEAIDRAGLPQPGKSSCFFCPSMRRREILQLQACHPDLLERALAIEAGAATRGSVRGLGRRWSWSDFLQADNAQQKLFPNAPKPLCGCYDG